MDEMHLAFLVAIPGIIPTGTHVEINGVFHAVGVECFPESLKLYWLAVGNADSSVTVFAETAVLIDGIISEWLAVGQFPVIYNHILCESHSAGFFGFLEQIGTSLFA